MSGTGRGRGLGHMFNNHENNDGDNTNAPLQITLSQADLMAIATIVATTLQGLGNMNANPRPPPNGTKFHYESLRRARVPTFDENHDPEAAHNWIKEIENHLRLLEVPQEIRVDVITPFLTGEAAKWWESISPAMIENGPIDWPSFRTAFMRRYFPTALALRSQKMVEFDNLTQALRSQKMVEFDNLTQAPGMSVIEYSSRFHSIGNYFPMVMADEEMKIHWFKKGLSSRIQTALAVQEYHDLEGMTGAAIRVENDIKRREDENKLKRPALSQNAKGQKFKKSNPSNDQFKKSATLQLSKGARLCMICGYVHAGECRFKTGACFNCGQFGHRVAGYSYLRRNPNTGAVPRGNNPGNIAPEKGDTPDNRVTVLAEDLNSEQMEFCPTCGNMLLYKLPYMERLARFFCPTCPYICEIESKVKIKRHLRLAKKPIDPIFSKEDSNNFNTTTAVPCPECNHKEAYFSQVQTRSADEPMTLFYNCRKCNYTWRED